MAKTVAPTFVEVIERDPPAGAEPAHWRLLTTHAAADAEGAWHIVDWYRRRWTIEQLFRLMKQQGLRLEDSQLADAASLLKLTLVATKAAVTILQLVQARDGCGAEPASLAFDDDEQRLLAHLDARRPATTAKQRNHKALARSPGPPPSSPVSAAGTATLCRDRQAPSPSADGWRMRDVCMP